ncbi:hypothetical protein CVT24_008859 [Panaeolus cyanescens]|uniref:DUF6697 domain-containing protein n=1 Tax=Panaeolus cyanescens TaxID=181874 RepID=A0A409VAV3_9AGAR|nr:hypothetical protein CVT24_008859 [Panaeolus cyanescens]
MLFSTQHYIPDLLVNWPWKRICNPHFTKVEGDSLQWIEDLKLFEPKQLQKYKSCKFEHLRISCDLMNFYFAYDAYTDVTDKTTARKISEDVVHILRGEAIDTEAEHACKPLNRLTQEWTGDYSHGQPLAKSLAVKQPGQAVMNADGHEYSAENTSTLSPRTHHRSDDTAVASDELLVAPINGGAGCTSNLSPYTCFTSFVFNKSDCICWPIVDRPFDINHHHPPIFQLMEDLFHQLQEELRLLREERERDKIIRLALEKKLQEAGILDPPAPEIVLDEQPVENTRPLVDIEDVVEAPLTPSSSLEAQSDDQDYDMGYLSDLTEMSDDEDSNDEADAVSQRAGTPTPTPAPPKPELISPRAPSRHATEVSTSTSRTPFTPVTPTPRSSEIPDTIIPKGKKKQAGASASASTFILSASRRADYLHGTSLFAIDPPPKPIVLSRAALNFEYRCTTMGLLWRSPGGAHKQFLFPRYELNPDMPRGPGEPGLLLGCRDELWRYGPWTMFYQLDNRDGESKAVRIGYAGEYKCAVVGALSKEEFGAQSYEVKKSWADKIATKVQYECYVAIRARITLRKAHPGREPTPAEVEAKIKAIKKLKSRGEIELSSEDVIGAFLRGEESIQVIRVECVGYYHTKAEEYLPLQGVYEAKKKAEKGGKARASETGNKGKGKGKEKSKASSKRKKTTGRKRAASWSAGDDDSDDHDDEAEYDDEDMGNGSDREAGGRDFSSGRAHSSGSAVAGGSHSQRPIKRPRRAPLQDHTVTAQASSSSTVPNDGGDGEMVPSSSLHAGDKDAARNDSVTSFVPVAGDDDTPMRSVRARKKTFKAMYRGDLDSE